MLNFRGLLTPHANWSAMIPRPVDYVQDARQQSSPTYLTNIYISPRVTQNTR